MAYASFAELLTAARAAGSLGRAALDRELAESDTTEAEARARMHEALDVMRSSVSEGLAGNAVARSGLVGGDARRVAHSDAGPLGGDFSRSLAAALAVAEVNASMGRVVAAPTGGASGVLPAVLLVIGERSGADDDALVDSLFAAAGVGGVIAARASLSGAAHGCQAEIGAAAAMAAAAAVQLLGGTPDQAEHGASLALQGLLGLVCDPVGGLVQVPCVVRNATGVSVALAGAELALAGVEFPIPFDEVVDALSHVGRSLPPSLRETARGGLAATPTGQRLGRHAREPRDQTAESFAAGGTHGSN